jgi:malate dehydrogenase (oxaloacetate-decarboxylating)(NADP+)
VYNDDVQGTAGIVLTGMINAAKINGKKLNDERFLFLGAGSAGIGLADLLCSAMVQEGLTLKQAQSRVYMFDINGLLEDTRKDLVDFQKPYAHKHAPTRDFVAAIESIKPTTIIGVSTVGGTFTQKVIESMSRIPIAFLNELNSIAALVLVRGARLSIPSKRPKLMAPDKPGSRRYSIQTNQDRPRLT